MLGHCPDGAVAADREHDVGSPVECLLRGPAARVVLAGLVPGDREVRRVRECRLEFLPGDLLRRIPDDTHVLFAHPAVLSTPPFEPTAHEHPSLFRTEGSRLRWTDSIGSPGRAVRYRGSAAASSQGPRGRRRRARTASRAAGSPSSARRRSKPPLRPGACTLRRRGTPSRRRWSTPPAWPPAGRRPRRRPAGQPDLPGPSASRRPGGRPPNCRPVLPLPWTRASFSQFSTGSVYHIRSAPGSPAACSSASVTTASSVRSPGVPPAVEAWMLPPSNGTASATASANLELGPAR